MLKASSDAADKLEALRTKLSLHDSPEADPNELAALEVATSDLSTFISREPPKPSFIEKKIQKLQVACAPSMPAAPSIFWHHRPFSKISVELLIGS